MKVLSATSQADWRILELKRKQEDKEQDEYTYKTFNKILDRIVDVTNKKDSGRIISLLSKQIKEVLKQLGLEGIESSRKQGKLVTFLSLMAEDEIFKRENAVSDITFRAEALRKYLDRFTLDEDCKRRFYTEVYKELKLSIFLTE